MKAEKEGMAGASDNQTEREMNDETVAEIKMNEATGNATTGNETAGNASDAESGGTAPAEENGNSTNSTNNGTANATDSAANATTSANQTRNDSADANETAGTGGNATNPDGSNQTNSTNETVDGNVTGPLVPYLLSTKNNPNPHDQAALYLSKTIVDMQNSSYYKNSGQAKNFETFGHSFDENGKWRFWIVEDRVDEFNNTGIYMKEVIKEGDEIEVLFERLLFRDAARARLYFPDDQLTGAIVVVFESYKECHLKWSHLSIA